MNYQEALRKRVEYFDEHPDAPKDDPAVAKYLVIMNRLNGDEDDFDIDELENTDQLIVDLYQQGKSQSEIAAKIDMTQANVSYRLRALGITNTRKNKRITYEQLRAEVEAGTSMYKLVKKYHIYIGTVKKYIQQSGLKDDYERIQADQHQYMFIDGDEVREYPDLKSIKHGEHLHNNEVYKQCQAKGQVMNKFEYLRRTKR